MKKKQNRTVVLSSDQAAIDQARAQLATLVEAAQKAVDEFNALGFEKKAADYPLNHFLTNPDQIIREMKIQRIGKDSLNLNGLKVKIEALLSMADFSDINPQPYREACTRAQAAMEQGMPSIVIMLEGDRIVVNEDEFHGRFIAPHQVIVKDEKGLIIYDAIEKARLALIELNDLVVEDGDKLFKGRGIDPASMSRFFKYGDGELKHNPRWQSRRRITGRI